MIVPNTGCLERLLHEDGIHAVSLIMQSCPARLRSSDRSGLLMLAFSLYVIHADESAKEQQQWLQLVPRNEDCKTRAMMYNVKYR